MEISKCCQILGQIGNIELEGTHSYWIGSIKMLKRKEPQWTIKR